MLLQAQVLHALGREHVPHLGERGHLDLGHAAGERVATRGRDARRRSLRVCAPLTKAGIDFGDLHSPPQIYPAGNWHGFEVYRPVFNCLVGTAVYSSPPHRRKRVRFG